MAFEKNRGKILTIPEAARYLGYSAHTIRKYIQRDLLKAGKIGSTVILDQAECERFAREKRPPGRPPQKK